MQTGTSRNLIVRTNREFEKYMNIEILEFIYVHIVNCQAEEGLVRAHGSIPCGCFKESRCRRWLSRMLALVTRTCEFCDLIRFRTTESSKRGESNKYYGNSSKRSRRNVAMDVFH